MIRFILFLLFFTAAWAIKLQAAPEGACSYLEKLAAQHKQYNTPETQKYLAVGYNNCGLEYASQKKWNTAETYLQKAKQMGGEELVAKNLAGVIAGRGKEAFDANDLRAAQDDFEKALHYDPDNPEIKVALSQVLYRTQSDSGRAQTLLSEGADKIPAQVLQQRSEQLGREVEVEKISREEKKGIWILRVQENLPDLDIEGIFKRVDETAYQLSRDFNYEIKHSQIIVLVDESHFSRVHSGPVWAGAVNDGRIKVPVTGFYKDPEEFKKVLAHELTHTIVNDLAHGNFVPFLFHEGLAEYQELKLSGKTAFEFYDYKLLRPALDQNRLIPLQALTADDAAYRLTPAEAALAYEQARAFVYYLADTYQPYTLEAVVRKIGSGAGFEDALRTGTGNTLAFLEDEWKSWLRYQS